MAGESKTSKNYATHPEAKKKKEEYAESYNEEYNKKPEEKKYRRELAQERRDRGVMGKGGKDMSHTKDGKIVPEDPSTNRARNGKNGKSTKK